ncbi:MAG: tripartite tricarboxylate transporter substrate binding protein, partial [Burkholderiaceae bacterium]|nr:tripartite tricarboxylate transporter substrate binding protein [Burkholderiaceae bacterium]
MSTSPRSIRRRHWLSGASALTAAALTAPALRAQAAYPSRPIKIIVPFSAGGTTDILARELAMRFTEKWKVSVVA